MDHENETRKRIREALKVMVGLALKGFTIGI